MAWTPAAPQRTAVVFVECQRGVVGDLSVLPALAEAAQPALGAMGRLAAGARAAGAQVVHLLYVPLLAGRSASKKAPLMRATAATATWTPDSPELAVATEIGNEPGDLVLTRAQGVSPVYRTEVLTILRNLGITEVVVAGASTNWAIPLTVAAVADEDFQPVVPVDATVGVPAEHHRSMLDHALGFVAKLTTVDDLLAAWATDRPPS